jgi:hypothetical protein
VRGLFLAAALALANGQALAADQFDLLCKGTSRAEPGGAEVAWSKRYSIDLGAGAFCDQGCSVRQTIARIEPGLIYLRDDRPITAPVGSGRVLLVNRADASILEHGYGALVTGTCDLAPFTPLPKNKF